MAQLTYDDIDDNAIRSVTAPNTFVASATTQSSSVSASNWRDEGLDERVVGASSAYSGPGAVEYSAGFVAVNTLNVWTTLALGASTFTISGAWTQGQAVGQIRVRFATEFQYTYPGHAVSETISFRLVYREDGGGTTVVPNSTRDFFAIDTIFAVGVAKVYDALYRDNFKYSFLIPYTADGASHTLTSVSVQYKTTAGGYDIGNTTFQAAKFVKAVV